MSSPTGLVRTSAGRRVSRLWHPAALLLMAWTGWLVVYLVSGVRYHFPTHGHGHVWLAAAVLATVVGTLLVPGSRRGGPTAAPLRMTSDAQVRRVVVGAALVGLGSVLLRLIMDQPVLPAMSALAVAESREGLADAGVGVSTIGTPLATFGLASATLAAIVGGRSLGRGPLLLSALGFLQYIAFGLATGSRTHLAFSLITLVVARSIGRQRRALHWRTIVGLVVGALAIGIASVWVLGGRIEAQGRSPYDSLLYLQSAHKVELPESVVSAASGSPGASNVAYAGASVVHYVLHGTFEFDYLHAWRVEQEPPLGMGVSTFGPVVEPVANLFGREVQSPSDVLPYPGVYRTLWGGLLVDFGPIGMIIGSFSLGAVFGLFHRALMRRWSVGALVAFCPVAAIVVAAPFFNAVSGAYGLYCVVAHLIVSSVISMGSKR